MQSVTRPAEKLACHNFIAGEWLKDSGGEYDVYSPLYGDAIGMVSYACVDDIDESIAAAKSAQRSWAKMSMKAHTQILHNFRNILLSDKDKICEIITLENGKTFSESVAELMKGIEVLEFAKS